VVFLEFKLGVAYILVLFVLFEMIYVFSIALFVLGCLFCYLLIYDFSVQMMGRMRGNAFALMVVC
jgi:hypothetical protein